MAESDSRFSPLVTDPRFRRLRKKDVKVKVDPRFKSLFQDKKLGPQSGPSAEDESNVESDLARGAILAESSEDEEEGHDSRLPRESDEESVILHPKRAREKHIPPDGGHIDLDEDASAEPEAHVVEYSANVIEPVTSGVSGKETCRLAVVNLDWDHIRASDLYMVFSSVLGAQGSKTGQEDGKVLHVGIYLSDFGKERLKREEREGPPPEVFKRWQSSAIAISVDNVIKVDNGEEYDNDALRRYQLDRLRYFYAVVTCDTPRTASLIYRELDGTELERTANVIDLSFVPDGMEFATECREEATQSTSSMDTLDFSTTALRHSKVNLTWDEDDPRRKKFIRRSFTHKDTDEADFRAYIASSDSENISDDEPSRRDELRNLLLGLNGEDEQAFGKAFKSRADMEVTFMPGLTDAAAQEESDREETTLYRYQRKMKEKQKERRVGNKLLDTFAPPGNDDFFEAADSRPWNKTEQPAALLPDKEELALILDSGIERTVHFDMHAILRAEKANVQKRHIGKKKSQITDNDTFVLDVSDPRFNPLHEDTAFGLDPSHPKFQRTKAMTALLEARSSPKTYGRKLPGKTSRKRERSEMLGTLSTVNSTKRPRS
ncbi:hypothetical protein DACRYDRAFT_100166 [Dacryopinax primogenitus]|uniref:Uncharacterized protein n=1 Tax=Dacryopinax primogenitus (strain DJM 731) TaxID=1858805 RepID=M5FZF7_DACPD|nr:uncharacterized protein DACRYDRAFT_100166 [Dacryopinax primogenitus]EJU01899.1 hypothetical protein DACRYDRAFT_100166 [Dacryopinax primogenitus]